MTQMSDERAATPQRLRVDPRGNAVPHPWGMLCCWDQTQSVLDNRDRLEAELAAEREAAGKVRDRIDLADTMLANWQWNLEQGQLTNPAELLLSVRYIREAIKETEQ